MKLSSLYDNISNTSKNIPASVEPPPINNTDVKQYTNILSKKSFLNENKSIVLENTTQLPTNQQTAQLASQPTSQPANINSMLQNVLKRYNSSTPQEKNIIAKILLSLS